MKGPTCLAKAQTDVKGSQQNHREKWGKAPTLKPTQISALRKRGSEEYRKGAV